MPARIDIRAICGAGTGWRPGLAAACLLLFLSGQARAQPGDGRAAVDTRVFTLPDDDADVEASSLPPAEPPLPKPLASADLPPSNPLVGAFPRTSIAFGSDWLAGRNEYRAIIERESRAFGVPPAMVDAVMAVESRYNPASIGLAGEIGLMQVMLPTARMLGFSGTPAELAIPEINVHYGAKYLAGAWRLAGGDLCTAAMKYRAGHGETRFSLLSVDYCLRVRGHLAAQGAAVSGSVPQPTLGSRSSAHPPGRSISGRGTVNFAALNTQLRALTDRRASHDPN